MEYELIEVPEEEVINGKVVLNTGSNMADADNFAYGRAVKAGHKRKAKQMREERGYYVLLEDGTFM